jgi:hypothetical protein
MAKRTDPKRTLFDLAKSEGSGFVHQAYTPEFEAACRRIKADATTEDMHLFWEQGLEVAVPDSETTDRIASAPDEDILLEKSSEPGRPSEVRSQNVEEDRFLFDKFEHDSLFDAQPWSVPKEPELSPERAAHRREILADVADSRLAKSEQRVAHILHKFPDTRDSDIALSIRYWRLFQPEVIERWKTLDFEILFELDKIETLGRLRRMLQNDLRLFRGIEDSRAARESIQTEFYQYFAAHQDSLPEIRFYLDETGAEGDKPYRGVGGLCVINWKQFEKHHAALEKWRSELASPETIRFTDTGANKVDTAVSLLHQLRNRRAGVLFLGYALSSRGRPNEDIFTLFVHLVIDSLKHLRDHGCPIKDRSIRVIKEASSGFDEVYLKHMTRHLQDLVAMEFPGEMSVLSVEALPKGRTVLLECADLIAGGMQRRALGKGRNPKDLLAEAIINVTGIEDSEDVGAVFKYYPATR